MKEKTLEDYLNRYHDYPRLYCKSGLSFNLTVNGQYMDIKNSSHPIIALQQYEICSCSFVQVPPEELDEVIIKNGGCCFKSIDLNL